MLPMVVVGYLLTTSTTVPLALLALARKRLLSTSSFTPAPTKRMPTSSTKTRPARVGGLCHDRDFLVTAAEPRAGAARRSRRLLVLRALPPLPALPPLSTVRDARVV